MHSESSTASRISTRCGEVEARTAFLVYRSHLETDHQLLSGCREDVLRKVTQTPEWKQENLLRTE